MSAAEERIVADLIPWVAAETEANFKGSVGGWMALKIIKQFGLVDYFTRSLLRCQVARYGHKAGAALNLAVPRPELIFNGRWTTIINDMKDLCGTDPAVFGPIAEEAREDSGPVPHFG